MKNIKNIVIFSSLLVFGNSALLSEVFMVIDVNRVFQGTDLAKERYEELGDSSDYKELVDEAEAKNNERIKLAEKLQKDESTLSDSEKEEILKRGQSLIQSIQLLSQQIQAKNQEVRQKLEADQLEAFQKIGDELIKAKKIKMLFRAEALLAFDRSNKEVNLTTEFIDLMNKEQKK